VGSSEVLLLTRCVYAKMLDPRSEFGRRYLRLLVEEVRVEGRSAVMRGSHAAVAQVVGAGKLDAVDAVPRFGVGWLPKQGSNRPSIAEGCEAVDRQQNGQQTAS